MELGHKVLWEYCTQSKHSKGYDVLGTTNQAAMRQAAEDQYLAYILLVNSGGQHEHLRKELQNNSTKGRDKYPENCSQTLLFLDRYSKSAPADSVLQGTAFAQRGGELKKGKEKKGSNKSKAIKKDFDKEYFKDIPCFKCGKKGHPQSHCPTKSNDDDNLSISSKSNRSSKSGGKPKIKNFENQFKNLKKSFAQLKSAQEGNLSSNSSEEMLHFQYGSRINGGGCLPKALMDMAFKQSMKGLQGFNLRGVVLLNNQSTVDIFCNKEFVSNIRPAPEPLILKSNGGELIAHHIANIADYDEPVWFSKKAITNIFILKNMKKQYRVTYNSLEETFLVHREAAGLPNLLFKEHGNGLHLFDPRQAHFAFVETVESNMRLYSKWQVAHPDKACSLYASLGFPSQKDFMWILRSTKSKTLL